MIKEMASIQIMVDNHRKDKLPHTRNKLAKILKERKAVIKFRHSMPEIRYSEVSKPMAEFIEKNRETVK
jgi:hypothetical protein